MSNSNENQQMFFIEINLHTFEFKFLSSNKSDETFSGISKPQLVSSYALSDNQNCNPDKPACLFYVT